MKMFRSNILGSFASPLLIAFIATLLFADFAQARRPRTIIVPDQYSTIQGALNASADGDTVVIRPGIYSENLTFPNASISVRSTDPTNQSIAEQTIIDGSGTGTVVLLGSSLPVLIEGLTIRNGYSVNQGGGINAVSPLTIRNCRLLNNESQYAAPALFGYSVVMEDCIVSGNSTGFNGGTIYASSLTIKNSTISGNVGGAFSLQGAGAVNISGCTISDNTYGSAFFISLGVPAVIEDCYISNNTSDDGMGNGNGGAFYFAHNNGHPAQQLIRNCQIVGNSSVHVRGGGAVYCWDSSPVFENCTFRANFGAGPGGAISFTVGSRPKVLNCIFENNQSSTFGGAIFGWNSGLDVLNSTLVGNFAISGGGAMYFDGPSDNGLAAITNSILWMNSNPTGLDQIGVSWTGISWTEITVTYSDVEGGWLGTGNIDADPLFLSPATSDYRLGTGSPCVDSGADLSSSGVVADIVGTLRPQGTAYDLGAFEQTSAICFDTDGDGWTTCGGDCDDRSAAVNPGSDEKGSRRRDGVDNDCNGIIDG